MPFDEDGEVAAARQYLEGQVTRLRERGKHVSGKVTVGQPVGVIAALAREQHADLVVMATHGHGGLSRLLLGSVATSTLHQTTVPLLLDATGRDAPGRAGARARSRDECNGEDCADGGGE